MHPVLAFTFGWAKTNWRLLLIIAALVAVVIRVEVGLAESTRIALWARRSSSSEALDAQREAESARSAASQARRIAEDAKSDAESALTELRRISRALR
jgi:hypothetical protein